MRDARGRPARTRDPRRDSLEGVTETRNPFGQVLVALVTPMTAEGEVDWPAVEKHIDHVISEGADGIVVTGTTGETSTLTDAEKVRLVEVGKSVSGGRASVITGGGSNETAHAIELYKASAKAGAVHSLGESGPRRNSAKRKPGCMAPRWKMSTFMKWER